MITKSIQMEPQWLGQMRKEFDKPYMQKLSLFLDSEYEKKRVIYPPKPQYFEAFNKTPFDSVKVVIVGQDPYHGPDQAHGLCFSVAPQIKPPPSLVNIFKELESDLKIERPNHGFLLPWAEQGVFLINSTLTVENGKAGSHQKRGWEEFTDQVLAKLNERDAPLVFILWGSFAQKKGAFLNEKKHLVIKSPHPSPLSAYRGFFGTKPFSKANKFLIKNGQTPIEWNLS